MRFKLIYQFENTLKYMLLISGLGVFATRAFQKDDFLLEYRGELILAAEGDKRLVEYPEGILSYIYFYRQRGTLKKTW